MTKRIILVFMLTALANVSAQPVRTPETDRIVHLLNRTGFGPRAGDVERVRQMGVAAYVDEQLHPERIDDTALDTRLAQFDTWRSEPASVRTRYQGDPRAVLDQLQSQKVIRAIYSKRQLQEVLVDFWFNHFNVNWSKEGVQFVLPSYERDAIRPFALGKFRDLLRATARHPAMLVYLDNAASGAAGVNENYARELMELHTLGVDGGYSQKDVEAVARAFTGWSVTPEGAAFSFKAAQHVSGEKSVLGRSIASGGEQEAEAVLDLLASHPSTAKFIAAKLARRLVADNPPAALVERAARVFTDTGGDIRAVVAAILKSEEFAAPAAFHTKAKSPFETVVSAMRAVDAELQESLDSQAIEGELRGLDAGDIVLTKFGRRLRVSPATILSRAIQEMGQPLYQKAEPTGYPDNSEFWLSGWSVLHRTAFAASLVNNEILGTAVNVARLRAMLPAGLAEDAAVEAAMLAVTEPPALLPAARAPADAVSVAAVRAFALALGSPAFQRK